MKQVNTYALYDLGTQLHALKSLPTDPAQVAKGHTGILWTASFWLDQFLEAKTIPLEVSETTATNLSARLTSLGQKVFAAEEIQPWELTGLQNVLSQFETILAAELQKHLTYLVSQIGGYSMPLLVSKAEVNLAEDALEIIAEGARKDFREAGRCLAFEVPTAAGFHAMRATERVLRQYYQLVMKKDPERVDWGTCTQELKKAGANTKVVQVLDQIRDIHRNPLMHPQDFLTMKEAIGLFDIAKSAIGALAEEIVALTPKPEELPEVVGYGDVLGGLLAEPATSTTPIIEIPENKEKAS